MQSKYELPNGNTLIWLGGQPIYECEDVLILAGGDVLFLKPVRRLNGIEVRIDSQTLECEQFLEKYEWPNDSSGRDLFWELRRRFSEIEI